jgi:hypothetical protein
LLVGSKSPSSPMYSSSSESSQSSSMCLMTSLV